MTMQTQTFGQWQDLTPTRAASYQRMVLDANHLAMHWRRCSLSSDFWARYTTLFVPPSAQRGRLRREDIESLLAYLLNELFENCAKFSGGPFTEVVYQAWIAEESMTFQLTNHIEPEREGPFIAFINELLTNDPDELYFRRLEESAESNDKGSGLGYLTLIKDYGVRFGFRFQPTTHGNVAVEIQAFVHLEEM